jgi:hypothetical protein
MSEALKDRFVHVHVTPDTEAWVQWARGKLSDDIVNFIQTCPKAAYSEDKRDDEFPIVLQHSYRSWERADRLNKLPLNLNVRSELIRGCVGPEFATAFIRSLASQDIPLTALEILELAPETVRKVKKFVDGDKTRMDLLSASVDNMAAYAKGNPTTGEAKFKNICEFILLLPDDLASKAIAAIHDIPGWSDKILKYPTMRARLQKIHQASTIQPGKK